MLDRAETTDPRIALGAIREARSCLELLAKLTGDLQERQQVQLVTAPVPPQELTMADVVRDMAGACRATARAMRHGVSEVPEADLADFRDSVRALLRVAEPGSETSSAVARADDSLSTEGCETPPSGGPQWPGLPLS